MRSRREAARGMVPAPDFGGPQKCSRNCHAHLGILRANMVPVFRVALALANDDTAHGRRHRAAKLRSSAEEANRGVARALADFMRNA